MRFVNRFVIGPIFSLLGWVSGALLGLILFSFKWLINLPFTLYRRHKARQEEQRHPTPAQTTTQQPERTPTMQRVQVAQERVAPITRPVKPIGREM